MEGIVMKDRYVAAIAIIVFAVGTGLAVHSVRSQSEFCPQPWAASVTALLAPCQALYGAMAPEDLRMALLIHDEEPVPPCDRRAVVG